MSRLRARKEAIDEFAAAVEGRMRPVADVDLAAPENGHSNGNGNGAGAPARRPLGQLLVRDGAVTGAQLDDALAQQTESGQRLGEILLASGAVSEHALTNALADQHGLATIDLQRVRLDRDTVDVLASDVARRLRAIAVHRDVDTIEVAIADPAIEDLEEQLRVHVDAPVRLLMAMPSELAAAIDGAYQDTGAIGDALREFEERFGDRSRGAGASQHIAVDENAPVVRVVNLILERAVRDRASDVHIEPQENRVRVRVRTDGALHEVMSLPGSMAVPLVSRVKVMAGMNIVERRRSQDGQLEVDVLDRELDVRVSTTATVYGEKCVLRLLYKTRAFFDLTELGMAPDTLEGYRKLIRSPYGMVICAGPTGSGKTTTLYATVAAIDNDDINVMTIEDPVEYVFPSINQIRINEQAGITFASGLRSVLRQDPDAILVGEIRDIDTARIAVQAALTGHFVMSSLHATDAASALHRFLDMGIEPFLTASSLLGVVGQRLLRKICPHCVEEYTPNLEEVAFYEQSGGNMDKAAFVRGAGCNACGHTGYYERIGVFEVLTVTDTIKELIVAHAALSELRATAAGEGMRTLRREAMSLVERDQTTIAEVLRTVYVL